MKGSLVGGSDDLAAAVENGSFAQLLQAQSSSTLLPAALQEALQSATAAAEKRQPGAGAGVTLPPDLQQLIDKLTNRTTGIQRTPQSHDTHSNAFTGQALADWLQQHSSSQGSRQAAATTAQQLLELNLITAVSPQQPTLAEAKFSDDATHWYRLRSDAPRNVRWGVALNTTYWWSPAAAVRPAEVVAEELRGRILALYDKYLSPDGKGVRYSALRQDPAFWEYVDATAELQRVSMAHSGYSGYLVLLMVL